MNNYNVLIELPNVLRRFSDNHGSYVTFKRNEMVSKSTDSLVITQFNYSVILLYNVLFSNNNPFPAYSLTFTDNSVATTDSLSNML